MSRKNNKRVKRKHVRDCGALESGPPLHTLFGTKIQIFDQRVGPTSNSYLSIIPWERVTSHPIQSLLVLIKIIKSKTINFIWENITKQRTTRREGKSIAAIFIRLVVTFLFLFLHFKTLLKKSKNFIINYVSRLS